MSKISIITGLLVFFIISLRFWHIELNHLWVDEAWVVLTITEGSLFDMFFPSWRWQVTPPMLLLIARAFFAVVGFSNIHAHLLPAIASSISIVFGFLTLQNLSGRRYAAVLFVILFGLSDRVLSLSLQFKHYVTDGLCTLFLMYVAVYVFKHANGFAVLRNRVFVLLSIVCLFMSYTSIFVIPVIWICLLLRFKKEKNHEFLSMLIVHVIASIITFGAIYIVFIYPESNDGYLQNYWRKGFAFGGSVLEIFPSLFVELWNHFTYFFGSSRLGVFMKVYPLFLFISFICTLIGSVRKNVFIIICVVPIILNIAASFSGNYPFLGHRTAFFLVPIFLIIISCGLEMLVMQSKRYANIIFSILLIILSFPLFLGNRDLKFRTFVPGEKIEYFEEVATRSVGGEVIVYLSKNKIRTDIIQRLYFPQNQHQIIILDSDDKNTIQDIISSPNFSSNDSFLMATFNYWDQREQSHTEELQQLLRGCKLEELYKKENDLIHRVNCSK